MLAIPTAWLLLAAISAAWERGLAIWMGGLFGIIVAFLFLHGAAVLFRVRRQGRLGIRRTLMWVLALTLLFSLLVLPGIYFGEAELDLEGFDIFTPQGVVLALSTIWQVFLLMALGTLFLILRLAVQEIGADVIFWRLAGYSLTLFIVSGLVSFVYFNYFERELVQELRVRLTRKGL